MSERQRKLVTTLSLTHAVDFPFSSARPPCASISARKPARLMPLGRLLGVLAEAILKMCVCV